MDKFPIWLDGASVGELTVERERCYTRFAAQVRLSPDDLWCMWIVGERGELRLGVLVQGKTDIKIRKRFSDQLVLPIGGILRGEIRRVGSVRSEWERISSVDEITNSEWLQKKLRGQGGLLRKRCGKGQYIAIPYDKEKYFPAIELFCFARLLDVGGGLYLALLFNEKEQVTFGLDAILL